MASSILLSFVHTIVENKLPAFMLYAIYDMKVSRVSPLLTMHEILLRGSLAKLKRPTFKAVSLFSWWALEDSNL